MFCDFWEELSLVPMATNRPVTVADGTVAQVIGRVQKVPVSFRTLVVTPDFLVVRNAQFDAIIGSSTL